MKILIFILFPLICFAPPLWEEHYRSEEKDFSNKWWGSYYHHLESCGLSDTLIAICMVETGGKFPANNNVGGLRHGEGKTRTYPSLQEGVKAFKKVIELPKYKGISFQQFAKIYNEQPEIWMKRVEFWLNLIKNG